MTDIQDAHCTGSPPTVHRSPPGPIVVSRAGALTGLAGAVLYAIGVLLPGSAPKPDASVTRVIAFFVDQRGSLLTGMALELLAVGLLFWFIGYLRTVVGAGDPQSPAATAMTAAWVATLAIAAATTVPALAIIWRGAATTPPDLTRFAYDIQTLGVYAATSTTALVSIAAPSLVIWRTHVLPRWLAVLGAAEIALNLVELAGLSTRHGTFAGGYADGVGPLLWMVWMAAASVSMTWVRRTADR